MKRTMMAACILSLVACGGSKDDVATDQRDQWEAGQASLVYSFPDNAQQQVPVSSPVVLRFSSPVVPGNAALMADIVLKDAAGNQLDWDRIEDVDGAQSLLLYPKNNLSPLTTYHLSLPAIELQKGTTKARELTFSTRAAYEGPKSLVAEEEFRILRTLPNDMLTRHPKGGAIVEGSLDVMEFTTFRVQFSQPLDRSSVIYGDDSNATVQLAGPDGAVDAHVLVSGPYLTIDPKEDLQADASYQLVFTTGLKSIYGDTMPGGGFGNPDGTIAETISFTPKATGPRANMVQDIADTFGQLSPLTGKQINEVPMASVLLGPDTATQASGIVAAELAFVPDFPDATPLRVKRGSLIEGATINPVLIGGEVPAGFESGTVRMDFLSDATGYLLPNPYSESDDAPRQVRLWMDVAVSTETPEANGAVTQDLLHIELVGTSVVDPEEKRMVINAVGVVEPNVLGSERATGLLSFYMEEVPDQDNPPVVAEDTTGPVLQSWTLGTDEITGENKALLAKPGDPIIFNFNEAIDPESVSGNVRLFDGAGDEMDIEYHIDGSALVIKPAAVKVDTDAGTTITRPAFQLSPADAPNVYRVEVDGVADLAGNVSGNMPLVEDFELATVVPDYDLMDPGVSPNFEPSPVWVDRIKTSHSPVILAAYPGFPCALQEEFIAAGGLTGLFNGTTDIGQTYRDLSNGVAGMCAGGAPEITDGTELDSRAADDPVPVIDMPANRSIIIVFGKEIDPASVVLGETFVVEKIDEDEQVLGKVAGTVNVFDMTLKFTPTEPWEQGELYRYTLKSSGWAICSEGSGNIHRIIASEATEVAPCSTSGNARVLADHREFECGLDAVCDHEGLPLRTMPLALNSMRKLSNPHQEAISHYSWFTFGPSITAGGPEMTHFFRGAEPSRHVLQVLRTQPVADTNRNFVSDRTNLGNGDLDSIIKMRDWFVLVGETEARAIESISTGEFFYDTEEYGPEEVLVAGDLGFDQYPNYDPDGMKSPKNSVKVLSRFRSQGNAPVVSGANVGCGYNFEFSISPPANPFMPFSEVGDPRYCPDKKFSYLMSAAIAEVTDEVDENGRVTIKLWPSIVMGTSLELGLDTNALGAVYYSASVLSGPQIMRMRYAGPNKDQPITGWISKQDQRAMLRMDMAMYVDAPYASEWSPVTNPVSLISYPIEMSLHGDVKFLDDGRMEVEQYNTNLINLDVKLWSGNQGGQWAGYMDLFIPEYGSRINMISEPIK